jgi:NAD(P)-dependent dehydrogenase (short-subunit alcohol dehydrogenase family)
MNTEKGFSLKGKRALVTGGCQNFGLEIVTGLAQAGAGVIVTSRDQRKAFQRAAELAGRLDADIVGMSMDLCDEASIVDLFDAVGHEYGALDILVNNAGGHSPKACGYLERETLESWNAFIEPNLTGTFLTTREYAKLMMPKRSGCIINIASVSSLVGRDRSVYTPPMVPNPVAYTAAKAGMIGLTYDTAAYLGEYGIRVNCISPGGFERSQPHAFVEAYSSRTMLKRMGQNGDLKGVVVFLASEAAAYVTGHNLTVDGGFTRFK